MATDSVGIDPCEVLRPAVALRAETAWSGRYVDAYGGESAPDLRHGGAQAALDRAVLLLRNLPEHYASGLDVIADALVQGAADTIAADSIGDDSDDR